MFNEEGVRMLEAGGDRVNGPRDLQVPDIPIPNLPTTSDEDKLFGDEKRNEEAKQNLHTCFIWFIRCGALLLVSVLVARVLHLILPDKWCWLSADQIQGVDKILFSSSLGGMIGRQVKNLVPQEKK